MSTSTPLRNDRTDLDEEDEAILFERVTRRAHIQGPRVGDFIILRNGDVRRFTHDHGDRLQLTIKGEDGSFYFAPSGHLDYSGALDPAILKTALRQRQELCEGRVWFFHHNDRRAHNGVATVIPCRVYEEVV